MSDEQKIVLPDGHIHTMPDDNKHFESGKCWCEPILVYKDLIFGTEQWLHNSSRISETH